MPTEESIISEDLASRACTPCKAGASPMTEDEVRQHMAALPDWTLEDGGTRIARRYVFRDFADAFSFTGKIAALAEAENHHPDLGLGWGYVTASLQTHSIGGLHENDIIMAARIDRAFE